MSKKRKMTRREFLHASAVVAAGAASAACAPPATPTKEATPKPTATTKPEATPKPVAKYNEAPMLTELVEAGELPPVDERLPTEPLMLTQEWNEMPSDKIDLQIGQYGGTLHTVHPNPGWDPDAFIMNNEPLLRSPGLAVDDIRGNVLQSYEVSPDRKVFTFHMRKGLKWSDGVPVTTEDVRFAYEDVLLNEKLTPTFPAWLRVGGASDGEPMELEIIDDHTFRISFDEAYGRFDVQMALTSWRGYTDLLKPKHYLNQFHADYIPLEELEPLIKEEELAEGEWWTLFNQKDITNWELTNTDAVGFPVLYPWVMVESTATVTTLERNPYYFKVDAEGDQLPYIDRYRMELVADVEMSTMKVVQGEVDFLREDTALSDLPLYKENADKGGYRVFFSKHHCDPTCIYINLTYEDPVWREVVRDVRFRRALAFGINYEGIIDTVYAGFGEAPTTTPGEYDPERAKRLLDEIGLDERDADGYRLGPDGETFVIPFEVAKHAPDIVPVTELVVENWKALGIKTTMKVIESGLLGTRGDANELQASVIWDVEPMWRTGGWTDYLPFDRWGRLWEQWYESGGEKGEEPPQDIKRIYELYEEIMSVSPATPEDEALFDELYDILYENVYFFISTQEQIYPVIVSKKLGNVPDAGFGIAANLAGEQMFFKE